MENSVVTLNYFSEDEDGEYVQTESPVETEPLNFNHSTIFIPFGSSPDSSLDSEMFLYLAQLGANGVKRTCKTKESLQSYLNGKVMSFLGVGESKSTSANVYKVIIVTVVCSELDQKQEGLFEDKA